MHDAINAIAFEYYPPLRKIRKHFERNYAQPISLGEAAAMAGLESKHFSKFFRRKVGIGFKQWTTFIRVQKAMEFIRTENKALTDIAFAVGFQDMRTFERAFKTHTAMTPREFKAKVVTKLA